MSLKKNGIKTCAKCAPGQIATGQADTARPSEITNIAHDIASCNIKKSIHPS